MVVFMIPLTVRCWNAVVGNPHLLRLPFRALRSAQSLGGHWVPLGHAARRECLRFALTCHRELIAIQFHSHHSSIKLVANRASVAMYPERDGHNIECCLHITQVGDLTG
jgi:hypothetical protein